MNKRPLGHTGIEVSEISFGTVELGIPYGIGVDGEEDMLSPDEAIGLLRRALEHGITFFDTAPLYGRSEHLVGQAFAGRREQAVICTKCPSLTDDAGALLRGRELRSAVDSSLERSLTALKTDHVDVFLLHRVSEEILGDAEIADTLLAAKRDSRVRAVGGSTYTTSETLQLIESGVWDVAQVAYNLMDQRQGPLLNLAQARGVGIMVRSVLLKGVLTDRGRGLHPALQSVEQHRTAYTALLGDEARTLSELATRFVLSEPAASSVLLGIDRPEYLRQALDVADGRYLSSATMRRARELAYPDLESIDLHKWAQMGWLT